MTFSRSALSFATMQGQTPNQAAAPETSQTVASGLQQLFNSVLPPLMNEALVLMRTLPPWQPKVAHHLFVSTGQRLFLLLQAAHRSFHNNPYTEYFITATLTRGIMESATILITISRDSSGAALSDFLNSAEADANKRLAGLKKLELSNDPQISAAAKTESAAAQGILHVIQQVKQLTPLPPSSKKFPSVADRCRALGPDWEFHYEAIYRDLCAAVHGGFWKIPHAPSLALRAPDKGGAVLYEHCTTIAYAATFWGITVLECCSKHPDQAALAAFRNKLNTFLDQVHKTTNALLALTSDHTLAI